MSLSARAKVQIAIVATVLITTVFGRLLSDGFTITQVSDWDIQLAVALVLGVARPCCLPRIRPLGCAVANPASWPDPAGHG